MDAGQGVEAQSVANCYTAIEQGLEVMPVLNKMDLPPGRAGAGERGNREHHRHRRHRRRGLQRQERDGRAGVLERLVTAIPAPEGEIEAPLQALIIDSWFDNYLGVVSLVRVKNGWVKKGDKILVKSTGKVHQVDSVRGIHSEAHRDRRPEGGRGGFIIAGIEGYPRRAGGRYADS